MSMFEVSPFRVFCSIYVRVCIYMCVYISIYTYIYKYIYIHIHTYIHTYIRNIKYVLIPEVKIFRTQKHEANTAART